ncbi:hypothetical protein LINPERPRIM_LOCUS40395 [Linum perenne]
MNGQPSTDDGDDTQFSHRHVTFSDQKPDIHEQQQTMSLLQPSYARSKSLMTDELRNFRISLKWCALDQSSPLTKSISYLAFIFFVVVVPILTIVLYKDQHDHDLPGPLSFNNLVQVPESGLALISFLTLTSFFRRYGLRQLLFLDGLHRDSSFVRHGYSKELDKAFRYLAAILLPSFFLELAHKVVFFSTVHTSIPISSSVVRLQVNSVMFCMVMGSWVYRAGVFLLVCVLFRLTCELQILRLQGLHQLFQGFEPESCEVIFEEHVRIKKQLCFTSHRYRFFIIACLVAITVNQLGALLLILAYDSHKSFFNSADIVICSAVQISGLFMCLMGAARITHRAQAIVSIATRWHMIVTKTAASTITGTAAAEQKGTKTQATAADTSPEDDADDCDTSSSSQTLSSSSFQTRQSLVAYLQHNNGGITLFGFALDRGLLHTLFVFEFSLVLWILSKVVVLS